MNEKPKEFIATQETNPSALTSFLQTRMKLLKDQKAVEGLQELIVNYAGKGMSLPE